MQETEAQKRERHHQEVLQRLRGFRPIDDTFMRGMFKDNIPLAELVLRIIVGKPDLTLTKCETQADLKRVTGARSICLDAYATDSTGKKYDIEIQRSDNGADPHRARYHSSVMDVENLDKDQDYRELPEEFLEKMKQFLGEEYPEYLASYEEEPRSGLRVNTGRLTPEQFLDMAQTADWNLKPVPWTKNGFYYQGERPSRHPWYYAGLYYLQEPSAMSPAAWLPIKPGDRVLDLCAAPGGKSTELAAKLAGTGVLFSNDISNSRAKALLKNLEMFGAGNICVTSEAPEKMAGILPEFFDKILVDAPCSGEGMFRRDPSMVKSWNEKGPDYYAPLQRQILDCAVQMLAPGGKLVYSTCTFDRDEDEGTIEYILEKYPQMAVVPQKPEYGFEGSRGIEGCLRLFPHRLEGEGHFVALLEKRTEKPDANVKNLENAGEKALSDPLLVEKIEARLCRVAEDGKSRQMASGKAKGKTFGKGKNVAQNQTAEDFSPLFELLRQLPVRTWNPEQFYRDSERIYYLPAALAGDNTRYFKPLRCLRTGLLLGELKKGRFEPSQALAMNLRMQEFVNYLNFNASDERTIRYLKGETLTAAEEEAADGLVLICVDGFPLGWAQKRGGQLKNKYNPGWRWQ